VLSSDLLYLFGKNSQLRPILLIGRSDVRPQQVSQCVHGNMKLAPLPALGSLITLIGPPRHENRGMLRRDALRNLWLGRSGFYPFCEELGDSPVCAVVSFGTDFPMQQSNF